MITRVNDRPKKKKVNLESYAANLKGPDQTSNTRFLYENRSDLKAFRLSVSIFFRADGKKMTALLDKQAHADQGSDTNVISRTLVQHLGLEVFNVFKLWTS